MFVSKTRTYLHVSFPWLSGGFLINTTRRAQHTTMTAPCPFRCVSVYSHFFPLPLNLLRLISAIIYLDIVRSSLISAAFTSSINCSLHTPEQARHRLPKALYLRYAATSQEGAE